MTLDEWLSAGPEFRDAMRNGTLPDWSSLMTELERSLTRAEDELRLIHMDPKHRHLAKGHLTVARHTLKQLEDWCDG